ncbi:MAG: MFS transporter [Pirellulaceae bacterium]|nr:MFS transporter [Pirellulaceae bacterium]
MPTRLGQAVADEDQGAYGLVFWLCYIGNTSLMVAVSLLFRYSDFVISYLGGSEFQLGLIVGLGMVGALGMRLFQGLGIDRYGSRAIWLGSLVLFIASCLLHLTIGSAHGPGIFLARILWMVSVAGAFGASLAYISLRVTESRVAEMLGTLGTSGFVGMAVGPVVGDLIFASGAVTRQVVDRMFWCAAGMAVVSLICAAFATRGALRKRSSRRMPPLFWLIRRYHPGSLLLVAVAMGLTVSLPNTFLRPYTDRLGIGEIRNFFLVYAVTAFAVRLLTRRLTEQVGFRPLIFGGLISGGIATLLYMVVIDKWTLAIPATAAGVAHALLFPAVVAAGSLSFPTRYRGVATTLTLSMFDLGNLIGQPAVGALIEAAERLGLPPYPVMFCSVTLFLALVGGWFWLIGRSPARAASGRGQPAVVVARTPQPCVPVDDRLAAEQAASMLHVGLAHAEVARPAHELPKGVKSSVH